MHSTRIVAIRHGETDWNASGRIQGQRDIPLNALGHQQARLIAEALAPREPIDAIYSSDLARAMQTAAPLASRIGAHVLPDAGLRERHFGELQGHTFAAIRAQWPDRAERWRQRDPQWTPPGGESLRTFRSRVIEAVTALAEQNLDRHIALFTHGGVLDVLYRAATGLDLQAARTWEITNASIHRLLWSPGSGLVLVGWADTTHLAAPAIDERIA